MAKKKDKPAGFLSEFKLPQWTQAAEWLKHPRAGRYMALAGLLVVTAVATTRGLAYLDAHVHSLPKYDQFVTAVEWQDLPDLLRRPENRHILESVKNRIALSPTDKILDPTLAERVGRSLVDPSIGWVKSVEQVTVRPDGIVAVKCRFREPAAYVQHGEACYLVDATGFRLPGWYNVEDCATSRLLLIAGVVKPPPEIGYRWHGDDLQAGLRLAELVAGRTFRDQVDRIIVTNYEGRVDRKRPQIEIATNRAGSRIWWGQPPKLEDGTETTVDQKLALLDWLYHEHGRIDLNRAYVDIRTHPNSVSIAKAHNPT